MSITKELREWAYSSTTNEVLLSNPPRRVVHGVLETLIGIADRIDAEHEANESYWQAESYKDGYDEGFASADDALSREENGMLAEHGFIRLPKDADGEYIHIGDVMRLGSCERDLTVLGIGTEDANGRDERGVFVLDGDDYAWHNAQFLHHYDSGWRNDMETHVQWALGAGAWVHEPDPDDVDEDDQPKHRVRYVFETEVAG